MTTVTYRLICEARKLVVRTKFGTNFTNLLGNSLNIHFLDPQINQPPKKLSCKCHYPFNPGRNFYVWFD